MNISPTTSTPSFQAGNIKLIGFRKEELSETFNQMFDFAKRKEIDFSILKQDNKYASKFDTFSIIASKDFENEPHKLQGTAISTVNKGADKNFRSLQIMNGILNAVDIINKKITMIN